MKRLLKSPAVNAVCLSVFSAFYAAVFLISSGGTGPDGGFPAGTQRLIACALAAATALTVVLLLTRRRPYDEYHTALLTNCLVTAAVLTLIAIAVFYLVVLSDPAGTAGKFTVFIVVHWATVVLADLTYVLLCRWK